MLLILPLILLWPCAHTELDAEESPHVVILVGESNHYGSRVSMPVLAKELKERFSFRVTYIDNELASQKDKKIPAKSLNGIEAIQKADLLIMFLRFREPTDEQVKVLQDYFDAGKPAIAFRDTSHLFWKKRKGWFADVFGGHYKGHGPNGAGTTALVAADGQSHPILNGVGRSVHYPSGGVYNAQPLSDTVTPLIFGKTAGAVAEPVAWVNEYKPGSRLFYTSLGSQQNFEDSNHKNMILNAVFWCLGRQIPEAGVLKMMARPAAKVIDLPAPPKLNAPFDALVLFDGSDLSLWKHYDMSVEPLSMGIDYRAETSEGGPKFNDARWPIVDRAVEARPGFGDILTRQTYTNYHLHFDFLVPPEPDYVKGEFRGASGVYLSGRYEIQILDSHGKEPSKESCGAIHGVQSPLKNASKPAGEWQSMDITYSHLEGEPAVISVWLNGEQVQKDVAISKTTRHGFLEALQSSKPQISGKSSQKIGHTGIGRFTASKEQSSKLKIGNSEFTALARFKTKGDGSLFSKAPTKGIWKPNGKTVFLRGGRLVYDIGWMGAISSKKSFRDNRWHMMVLTYHEDEARLYVDGKRVASRNGFTRADEPDHVFKIGATSTDFALDFGGDISDVRFYGHSVDEETARALTNGKYPEMDNPLFEWGSKEVATSKAKPLMVEVTNDLDETISVHQINGEGGLRKITDIGPKNDLERSTEARQRWIAMVGDKIVSAFIAKDGENEWEVSAEDAERVSKLSWIRAMGKPFRAIDGLKGPIRLQADCSKVRFSNIWIRPLGDFDHPAAVRFDRETLSRGERIYAGLCVNCHGRDGVTPGQPDARAFGKGEIKFGADPYSMFKTLTYGNGKMAPQTWMTPEERYAVIHYIRETFMKPMNPAYRPTGDIYLANLPKPIYRSKKESAPPKGRDFGLALASQLRKDYVSALTIKLPEKTTISYNLHTMDIAGAWQGGFLNVSSTQHMRLRGEGQPQPVGKMFDGLQTWKWAHDGTFDYPKDDLLPRGPLPEKWLDYRGHYVSGDRLVLSYKIDGRHLLELPGKQEGFPALVNTLQIKPGETALRLCVGQDEKSSIFGVLSLKDADQKTQKPETPFGELKSKTADAKGNLAIAAQAADGKLGSFLVVALRGEMDEMTLEIDEQKRLILNIPPGEKKQTVEIVRYSGKGNQGVQEFLGVHSLRDIRGKVADPGQFTKGGPARWAEVVTTRGTLGPDDKAYTLDTLTIPKTNKWNSWLRTTALDFYDDGRMAFSTHGGDIWVISGIDDKLENLKWKRFAAGLYEPFGVKVIGNDVYVTCKDRLVRLQDFNNDGEADFYESFSADTDVSIFFHAYNFDLHTDTKGNFYYVKCGMYTDNAMPGSVIKITPDGRKRENVCTGFRTPNGMGISADDKLFVSDNQGNWIPASKVCMVKKGGFYGYVPNIKSGGWAPDGGRIDISKVKVPETFDQPIIWMPQEFDNSSGGQVWIGDKRWGPLAGRMLHTSFGKGWLYYFMIQDFGDVAHSAIVKMPLDFMTGIQRARVNPKDGQVYATGLNGWNARGRRGLVENGIQRARYTGKPVKLLMDTKVRKGGLELTFNFELEQEYASKPESYNIEQWNYRWAQSYGSALWSVKDPKKKGRDKVTVESVEIRNEGKTAFLSIPDIQPVNQMLIRLSLKGKDGGEFKEQAYMTINRVPEE